MIKHLSQFIGFFGAILSMILIFLKFYLISVNSKIGELIPNYSVLITAVVIFSLLFCVVIGFHKDKKPEPLEFDEHRAWEEIRNKIRQE